MCKNSQKAYNMYSKVVGYQYEMFLYHAKFYCFQESAILSQHYPEHIHVHSRSIQKFEIFQFLDDQKMLKKFLWIGSFLWCPSKKKLSEHAGPKGYMSFYTFFQNQHDAIAKKS